MNKKEQLIAALIDRQASGDDAVVRRLLTPLEWDAVAAGDGHSQGGAYTQTSGNFTQAGGNHSQTGGGGYGMSGIVKSRPNPH